MTKEKFDHLFARSFGFGIAMAILFVLVAPPLVAARECKARNAMELQNVELRTRLEMCKNFQERTN